MACSPKSAHDTMIPSSVGVLCGVSLIVGIIVVFVRRKVSKVGEDDYFDHVEECPPGFLLKN